MVLVLTGPVHAGKTTFLERACRRWSERGLFCAGFLSPVVTDANGDSGYDLLELPGGSRRPYLRRREEPGAERIGPFAFAAGALDRALSILRDPGRAGLLVVDEVGPLELRGGGLWPALREAIRQPERTSLLVVRDAIVGELSAALAPLVPVVFDVRDPEDRRLLEERVFAGLTSHDGHS